MSFARTQVIKRNPAEALFDHLKSKCNSDSDRKVAIKRILDTEHGIELALRLHTYKRCLFIYLIKH